MITNVLLRSVILPVVEKTTKSYFWSLYQSANRLQESSDPSKLAAQQQRLSILLKEAVDNVQIWQEIASELELKPRDLSPENVLKTLARFPVSQKLTYSSGFPDRVTNATNRNAYQYLSSSGTTGRMTVITDFTKRDCLRAAEHLTMMRGLNSPIPPRTLDLPPSSCNVVCGLVDQGPEPLLGFIYWSLRKGNLFKPETLSDIKGRVERQLILKRKTLLPVEPGEWASICIQLDRYLDIIQHENIKVLRGLPHFLYWLALRVRERGLKLDKLQTVIPYGGLASDVMIEKIQSALGARFINSYGTGEVGAIGCAMSRQASVDSDDTIHVYPSMVFIEILDDEDQPVAENGIGRIVVTDLRNMAMPIIRYDIGDLAQVITREESSCLSFKILGRKQECFRNMAGELITSRDLQNLFFAHDGVLNFRLDQVTASAYRVTIAATGDINTSKLAKDLQSLLGLPKSPTIKIKPFLLPEGSGKYIGFKSSIRQSGRSR